MFFIKDEKFIMVEKLGARDASYDDFLTDLQAAGEGECRYGLYDFEYEHQCQVSSGDRFLSSNVLSHHNLASCDLTRVLSGNHRKL